MIAIENQTVKCMKKKIRLLAVQPDVNNFMDGFAFITWPKKMQTVKSTGVNKQRLLENLHRFDRGANLL